MPYKDGWDLGKFLGVVWGFIQLAVFIFFLWIALYTLIVIHDTHTIVKDIQQTLKDKSNDSQPS